MVMNTRAAQTYSQTPTEVIGTADGLDISYRRAGSGGDVPLVLATYFASNMDDWDPLIVDGLAVDREVITFDYPGVGGSTGVTPSTVSELTACCLGFLRALGLANVDFLGFSLGGMVAQQMAFEQPELIRRMVLCGTGPRGGENLTFTELSIDELEDPVKLLLTSFFTPSEASQSAGNAYLGRLSLRTSERDLPVSRASAETQLGAIREWGTIPASDRYEMLSGITQPTLIVHGNKDVVVDPINAFILAERLPNATLLMFPDASHGSQSQHAEVFLSNARLFLNG
jgi:pimeloyl-ACP methyl ester carboxylesterase